MAGPQRYLEDQGIAIAQGRVVGTSCINNFGATGAAVTINTETTIWDGSNTTALYPYPTAGVAAVTANTTDDGEVVVVEGLDADYNLRSTTIPVGAASPVVFSRIFRAFMESTPNGADVDITIGGALAARIKAGFNQTEMGVYTIPAGKTGFLLKIHGSSDRSAGSPAVQFFLKKRGVNESLFRIKGTYGTAGGNQFDYEYPVPIMIPEKTDIQVNAKATSTTKISCIFDIILVDN